MKFRSVYTDSCFKLVCYSATATATAGRPQLLKSAICELQLPLTVHVPAGSRSRSVTFMISKALQYPKMK
jgi:hypothetical protein